MDDLYIRIHCELHSELGVFWEACRTDASKLIEKYRAAGQDDYANQAWFLSKVSEVREQYIEAWNKIGKKDFYDAWCILEQVEIGCSRILNNPFYPPEKFEIDTLAKLVNSWQSIYPYRVFFSPEFVIKKKKCSICEQHVSPWSICGHDPKKVYAGKECFRIIEDCEFLSISVVDKPVQKYSVGFLSGEDGKQIDQYNYSAVTFVYDRLVAPFDGWKAEWTHAYHPHELFEDVLLNDKCPCESGRQYSDCCRSKLGVLRPHLEVIFEKDPLPKFPQVQYIDQNGHVQFLKPSLG